jgi:hypothetical protein
MSCEGEGQGDWKNEGTSVRQENRGYERTNSTR